MDKEILTFIRSGASLCGWWDNYYGGAGIEVPLTDTIYTGSGQLIFPILRPKGYLTTGKQIAMAESVRLMPNPARTKVTVEAADAISEVQVSDMMGRVLMSERYDGDVRSVTLDVSGLAQGSYVVRVNMERESATCKLMVE